PQPGRKGCAADDKNPGAKIRVKWARPDLNWRLLHPKQQGYQTTPRAPRRRGAAAAVIVRVHARKAWGLGRRGGPGPVHRSSRRMAQARGLACRIWLLR